MPYALRIATWVVATMLLVATPHTATASGLLTDVLAEPAIQEDVFPQPTPPKAPEISDIERSGVIEPQIPNRNREHVVILHGIGRSSMSMSDIVRAVRKAGYEDHNIGYSSTRDTLHVIIDDVYKRIRSFSDDEKEVVNFVCYSLGCLVTRGIIEQHRPAHLGRVVMLGPPNQGSEMADYLKDHAVSNWLFGPNLPQLGTGNRKMLEKLIGTSADYELGIIAGRDTIDPLATAIIPNADDGRVSVERTKLPGAKEHIVMNANHTTLITNDAVVEQAIKFIQNGHFDHDPRNN